MSTLTRGLPRLWSRAPWALRRPVVRLMRNEKLRLTALHLLGIRSRDDFISVSAGGAAAIEAAMDLVAKAGPTGDYYEFGLFRGYTFWWAQRCADRAAIRRMRFFGFDSFCGLPEVAGEDLKSGMFIPGDYRCGREEVVKYITDSGYDWSRGVLIEGFFDQSLTPDVKRQNSMGPAAVIMIDCDLYQSTVPVLHFIADLLQDGTVLLFDDWSCFSEDADKGEPRAFREFLSSHVDWSAEHLFDYPTFGSAFLMRRAHHGENTDRTVTSIESNGVNLPSAKETKVRGGSE